MEPRHRVFFESSAVDSNVQLCLGTGSLRNPAGQVDGGVGEEVATRNWTVSTLSDGGSGCVDSWCFEVFYV